MVRYAGDFQGACAACGEYVEFAVGLPPAGEGELTALRFGPGGPAPVPIRVFELARMMDDVLDLRFEFLCPICAQWSAGRAACRAR